ncbi:hypothetical protein DGM85_02430 [Xanthomonas phaseoli pv. phaseoli]|nr:hypothetical protein DGM93_02255 [Xanthomonas phaseoli pv. phaseoli]QWN30956.1 hypothetical protein DGM85_02430 [Xanthomonas phaseoli pv. phaseoli]QWN35091.1 hypothetical protein DGM81_02265 [Xanthomonas phaseoli pv. phaseoli]
MAISKPPGFSSIVIALLYLIVAMDPNRQHRDEEHAAIATGAGETRPHSAWQARRCSAGAAVTCLRGTASMGSKDPTRAAPLLPMTYRRYVLRDVGNVPISWLLPAGHTEQVRHTAHASRD